MEKQSSRSPATSKPAAEALFRVSAAHSVKDKPSRDAVSRCIGIWASVYGLREHDAGFDAADLRMPSRTWAGRALPRIDRFE